MNTTCQKALGEGTVSDQGDIQLLAFGKQAARLRRPVCKAVLHLFKSCHLSSLFLNKAAHDCIISARKGSVEQGATF